MDKSQFLELESMFRKIGLNGSNFVIHQNQEDNDRLAALLRAMANKINTGDTEKDAKWAEEFIKLANEV